MLLLEEIVQVFLQMCSIKFSGNHFTEFLQHWNLGFPGLVEPSKYGRFFTSLVNLTTKNFSGDKQVSEAKWTHYEGRSMKVSYRANSRNNESYNEINYYR